MLGFHFQAIYSLFQFICDIQSQCGAPYGMTTEILSVHCNSGVCTHSFKTKEIPFPGFYICREIFHIHSYSMQVSMCQLTVSIIIVPIMRNIHRFCRHHKITFQVSCLCNPGFPTLIQCHDLPAILTLRNRETDGRTSHRLTGSNGNATLLCVVYRTIEMINHSVMFHHIALMSKQFIVVLGGDNQVGPFPISPVHQIIAGGKCIECFIFTRRFKSREIKHHIHISHLLDMRISCYGSICFMRKDRIAGVAFPCFHIFGKSNADTFAL